MFRVYHVTKDETPVTVHSDAYELEQDALEILLQVFAQDLSLLRHSYAEFHAFWRSSTEYYLAFSSGEIRYRAYISEEA